MDRRQFIKISGTAAAAAGVVACAPKVMEKEDAAASSVSLEGTVPQHFDGVSLLGYGCMRWPMIEGDDGKKHIDQEAVNALVDEAIAHGVNYFDTSPVYLGGDSERATAEALSRHPRSEWLLATKLSNFSNWTYENSVEMYRKSLEIFNTDHIDYYLLHSISGGEVFDKRFGSTGIMDFLLSERQKGHIRHLGFSFHGSVQGFGEMLALHEKYHWDFVQIQMNYLDWTHAGGRNGNAKELYDMLAALDIPVVIMEPLRGGSLSDIPAPLVTRFKERESDASVASWAFRFAAHFPRALTVLSGMTYKEHLEDNLKTFIEGKPLSDDDLALLEEVAASLDSFPVVKCTGCQYCMPCPFGIDIPGVFAFYNKAINEDTYVKSAQQKDFARARRKYLASYDKAVESVRQADHCISCGRCMKACPQKIRIPSELDRINIYIESVKQGKV